MLLQKQQSKVMIWSSPTNSRASLAVSMGEGISSFLQVEHFYLFYVTSSFLVDGNTVISPVGNKISMFDLKNHRLLRNNSFCHTFPSQTCRSETLPVESRFTYTTADISPNGVSLLAANEEGEIHLISLIRWDFTENFCQQLIIFLQPFHSTSVTN